MARGYSYSIQIGTLIQKWQSRERLKDGFHTTNSLLGHQIINTIERRDEGKKPQVLCGIRRRRIHKVSQLRKRKQATGAKKEAEARGLRQFGGIKGG
jgi:hypothetical protein